MGPQKGGLANEQERLFDFFFSSYVVSSRYLVAICHTCFKMKETA